MQWHTHYINARGKLDDLITPFEAALADTYRRVSQISDPPHVDIVVEAVWESSVIPERGHTGFGNEDLVRIWLAPGHPRLEENLGEPLARTIAHEINHVLRFREAGGPKTLGDLLVSEGLAGRYVEQLFGNAPEPWEQAVSAAELGKFAPLALECFDTTAGYNRYGGAEIDTAEWMFAKGDLPRWLGYTMGYELVGHHLAALAGLNASDLSATPSAEFRPALEGLAA